MHEVKQRTLIKITYFVKWLVKFWTKKIFQRRYIKNFHYETLNVLGKNMNKLQILCIKYQGVDSMMTSEQKWIRFTVYENGGKTHSITRILLTFIAERQFPTPHLSFQIVRYSANRDKRITTEKGISFV